MLPEKKAAMLAKRAATLAAKKAAAEKQRRRDATTFVGTMAIMPLLTDFTRTTIRENLVQWIYES